MPILGRMLTSPLLVDIKPGAVAGLPALLKERFISTGGTVLVAVGGGQGSRLWDLLSPALPQAGHFVVRDGSLESAAELQRALAERAYDAVVAIGGGRTLDVAKYAATRAAVPMIAVATNLAHDGICSPVASLEHAGAKGSYGVSMPLAVVVDLEYVRAAPPRMVRSGIGDAVSNLSAVEDWKLAERVRGEPVDGLAVTFARTAAESVLGHPGTIADDDFLTALAEALVLSGMAMSVAGSSRPCSGACHEIVHAVDALFPGVSNHGELAGVGALFAYHLRGEPHRFAQIAGCLAHHGLPRTPTDLGLSRDQFVSAVLAAPDTRPDRYTILEHLALDEAAAGRAVDAYLARLGWAEPVAD